ncbi:MAG: G5 domain-containing protein [Patescibacteria group bacterium]|jgi:hypothetical protein
MNARLHAFLGLVFATGLSAVLWWLHSVRLAPTVVEASELEQGLGSVELGGVTHPVERVVTPPGMTNLTEALAAAGVVLEPEDRYVAVPDPVLGVGSWVEITRAIPVTLRDAEISRTHRTWAPTVGALLDELGVLIDADDRLTPAPETPLAHGLVITVTRVGVSDETERESIDYKTVRKQDPELEKGKTRVGQVGKVGTKKKTYEVVRENGQVVKRSLVATEVEREPVDEVVYEGTKVLSYGSGEATWYALRTGMQAAHNTLPFGTWVKVTSLASGKSVDVQITDRGIQGSAIIDLTADAFKLIAPLGAGRIQVKLEKDWD